MIIATLELNLNNAGTKGIDFMYSDNRMNIFVNMDNDNENFTVEHMRKLHDFVGSYLTNYEQVIVALEGTYADNYGEVLFTGTLNQCLGYEEGFKFDGRNVVMYRNDELIYWSEGWDWVKNE